MNEQNLELPEQLILKSFHGSSPSNYVLDTASKTIQGENRTWTQNDIIGVRILQEADCSFVGVVFQLFKGPLLVFEQADSSMYGLGQDLRLHLEKDEDYGCRFRADCEKNLLNKAEQSSTLSLGLGWSMKMFRSSGSDVFPCTYFDDVNNFGALSNKKGQVWLYNNDGSRLLVGEASGLRGKSVSIKSRSSDHEREERGSSEVQIFLGFKERNLKLYAYFSDRDYSAPSRDAKIESFLQKLLRKE